jgi:hypothetical protein
LKKPIDWQDEKEYEEELICTVVPFTAGFIGDLSETEQVLLTPTRRNQDDKKE